MIWPPPGGFFRKGGDTMAYDDFDVIVYKTLAYILRCAKDGVRPNIGKAQEVSKANDVYWAMVVRSMLDDGFIIGARAYTDITGVDRVEADRSFGITQKGARFLKENSKMNEVGRFLGGAFETVLAVAVAASQAL